MVPIISNGGMHIVSFFFYINSNKKTIESLGFCTLLGTWYRLLLLGKSFYAHLVLYQYIMYSLSSFYLYSWGNLQLHSHVSDIYFLEKRENLISYSGQCLDFGERGLITWSLGTH